MRAILLGLILAALLAPHPATAQARFYLCHVMGSYSVAKTGSLETTTSSFAAAKGERFQLNPETGTMSGDRFKSRVWARTVVLDDGSTPRGSSYKVIYTSPPGGEFMNVAYFQLDVFEKGPDKPFILIDFGELHTGNCRAAS